MGEDYHFSQRSGENMTDFINRFQDKVPQTYYVQEHCAWCWAQKHPTRSYPCDWSSTLCSVCQREQLAQLAQRRAFKGKKDQEARVELIALPIETVRVENFSLLP
jgi:hypothetical protein